MKFKTINQLSLVAALVILTLGGAAAYTALTTNTQATGRPSEETSRVAVVMSRFHAPGEFVNDHEGLVCAECHQPSAGSTRQQLQSIAKNVLFDSGYEVNFWFQAVSSQHCLECHSRDNDRHPIHRFNEPRFIEVVRDLPANQCLGCHSEHNGRTVNLTQIGFCEACHSDLKKKMTKSILAIQNW